MAPGGVTIQTQKTATSTTTDHKPPSETQREPSIYTNTDTIGTTDSTVTHRKLSTTSSQKSDTLPWVLMGMMTVLFCALLTANVICCVVFLLKKQKRGRYQLKRNPSYASSPRTVSARNVGFENHIYDFIPTT